MSSEALCRVIVLAPVYDDAAAATHLIKHLHEAFAKTNHSLTIVLVDDGSPIPLDQELAAPKDQIVEVLRLKRNVGHQRAIALGIAFVQEHKPCDVLLVMDADGEDRPEDALRLVERCGEIPEGRIVFADRTRRVESLAFRVLYRLYQFIHWVLTGIRVRVGNFSAVPASRLPAVVTLPGLWNHYAAAIYQSRLPRTSLPAARAPRYCGTSKMNWVSLVVHGLQAISVFIEIVVVRLLLSLCLLAAASVALFVVAWIVPLSPAVVRFASIVLISVMLLGVGCFALSLILLAQRNRLDFLPSRDYHFFIEGLHIPARTDG